MPIGRFAPSPSNLLHVGNLRTALVSWLCAASDGSDWLIRFDDQATGAEAVHADSQLTDLAALGLRWVGEPVWQSARTERHRAVVDELAGLGLLYPCFCSRADIRAAIDAPNGSAEQSAPQDEVQLPSDAYPGTCRSLSAADVADRMASGRPPAWRLDAQRSVVEFVDAVHGDQAMMVDDFVISRGDGAVAYNASSVIDDHDMGVGEVVRADDLIESAGRQTLLFQLLGWRTPDWCHVPLVVNEAGTRLSKRDGAVTMADLAAAAWTPEDLRSVLAASLGLADSHERPDLPTLVARFDRTRIPTTQWAWPAEPGGSLK